MFDMTSIIVLTYNQLKYTRLCLNSLKQNTDQPYELILVDNGSNDGTREYLKSLKPDKLILNEKNLGYSKGVNQGLRAAQGEQFLLLNNDTVVGTNWLKNQLSCLSSKAEIGIVGPRTNYAGSRQTGIFCPHNNLAEIEVFIQEFNRPDPAKWFEVDFIVGFCMLIKKDLLNRIGNLDESFEYGMFEDTDFCRRAVKSGFKLYCAGDAFVYHYGSRTFNNSNLNMAAIFNKNLKKFNYKWGEKE